MSIKEKATSGIKWTSASQFGRQAAQLITTVILARLLVPADFGLVAMATVAIGFITIFKDLGTSSALIQQSNVSEELRCSIYWVNVSFGFLAMLVLYFLSPYIAKYYNESRIVHVLQYLSFTFPISGLSIMHQALLEKELAFYKLAKLEIVATVSGSIVGIVSALMNCGVWSLVYQTIAVSIVTTILLWLACRWRPNFVFNVRELRRVRSYSLNLTGYSIFNYFVRNADYLLIGKYLGAQDLGYYTLAYRIMLYPLQSIASVLGRVMFPAFSQIQNDNTRICSAYLKVAATIAMVTFPMMLGLMVLVEPFVLLFFGQQWHPVIQLLIILAPVGLIQSIGTTVGSFYQTKGRTDWMFRWGILTGVLAILSFCIGLHWGIVGVAAAYAILTLLVTYPNFMIPFKLVNMPVLALVKVLQPPLFCSIIMAILIFILKQLLSNFLSSSIVFAIAFPVGFILYGILSWFANKGQIVQLLDIVKTR